MCEYFLTERLTIAQIINHYNKFIQQLQNVYNEEYTTDETIMADNKEAVHKLLLFLENTFKLKFKCKSLFIFCILYNLKN